MTRSDFLNRAPARMTRSDSKMEALKGGFWRMSLPGKPKIQRGSRKSLMWRAPAKPWAAASRPGKSLGIALKMWEDAVGCEKMDAKMKCERPGDADRGVPEGSRLIVVVQQ